MPLMHVDIHGKKDRKEDYDLDLGVQCLHKHWLKYEENDFLQAFVAKLTSGFNTVLNNIPKHKDYGAVCNNDPILSGNWGGELMTMTEQAVLMGIPSFQLEIPMKMRTVPLFWEAELGNRAITQKYSKVELVALHKAYIEYEKKASSTEKVI